MKKLLTIGTILLGLSSNVFAHHPSNSDMAGLNIVEWSPHLLMTF